MNKKWIASLACVCLLASSFTTVMAEGMKPGTYTEVARGMYDGLTVDVTVSESKIEDIKVTAYNETAPGWPALEKMPAAILEAQSLAVDTVSGATRTSEGILKAVEAALVEAGANVEDFKKPVEAKESAAPDYFAQAKPAIEEMLRQAGHPVFDAEGILQKGVILRHLALPGHIDEYPPVLQTMGRVSPCARAASSAERIHGRHCPGVTRLMLWAPCRCRSRKISAKCSTVISLPRPSALMG